MDYDQKSEAAIKETLQKASEEIHQIIHGQEMRRQFYDEQIQSALTALQEAVAGNEELSDKVELLAEMLRSRSQSK